MVGMPKILPAYAGFTLEEELDNLTVLVSNPEKPVMVMVGGSKVSTKLSLLQALVKKADYIVVGGGMANTFLLAQGYNVGKSLKEDDLVNDAKALLESAKANNCQVILPVDAVVAKEFVENASCKTVNVDAIAEDDIIMDLGEKTVENIKKALKECKVVIWNGPVGVYEMTPFNKGTDELAKHIANITDKGEIKSVAGGGDILAAINASKVGDKFTYISTAGGAFLKWLEKGELPAVEGLKKQFYIISNKLNINYFAKLCLVIFMIFVLSK